MDSVPQTQSLGHYQNGLWQVVADIGEVCGSFTMADGCGLLEGLEEDLACG